MQSFVDGVLLKVISPIRVRTRVRTRFRIRARTRVRTRVTVWVWVGCGCGLGVGWVWVCGRAPGPSLYGHLFCFLSSAAAGESGHACWSVGCPLGVQVGVRVGVEDVFVRVGLG